MRDQKSAAPAIRRCSGQIKRLPRRCGFASGILILLMLAARPALAAQQVLSGSGGTATIGTDFIVTGVNVTSAAGTISIDCPITSSGGSYPFIYHCSGGSFTYTSNDGTTSVTGSYLASQLDLWASGGGRGGNIHYNYQFFGSFTGVQIVNGVSAAIAGETSLVIGPLTKEIGSVGTTAGGSATGINWQYAPIYVTDNSNSQLVRSDDIFGTNKIVFGGYGSGANQFIYPIGVTTDSAGQIYVVDAGNCRIVRMDDMAGTNWTTLGNGCGTGVNQFSGANDIAVDSTGRIYVADAFNNRIVRFDNMTGANWVTLGTAGAGTNQLSDPEGVTVDAAGHIYIADTGNRRIVRVDDITGTNWTTLTQSPVINGYIYLFGAPAHVALDNLGRIVIGDGNNVIRVDDMTGTNWWELAAGATVEGVSVNSAGTTYVAGALLPTGTGEAIFDDITTGAGFMGSNLVTSPGGIYAVSVPTAVPAVTVAPASLAFGNEDTGISTAPQNVTITNFGSAPLEFNNVTASAGFAAGNACSSSLAGGSTCTIAVSFAPSVTGAQTGSLTISDNAFTGTQSVSLSGTGTAPVAGISPAAVTFDSQLLNTTSGGQSIFLSNTGSGPLFLSGNGISASGDFAQTNNCGTAVLAPTSCVITVTFTPTSAGTITGSITVTDNAGTQTVSLTGTGANAAPTVAASPESLVFPTQLLKSKSAAQSVTLTNTGKTAVSVSVAISGDFAKTGICPASLGAGKGCTIKVTFTPTAAGTRTGALTFTTAAGTIPVALTGTGTSTATGWLVISPTAIAFNNGYVVGDDASQTLTVTNSNGVPTGITKISLTGSSMFKQTNNCGTLLGPYATCTITVTFTPTVAGTFTGTLTVTEGAGTAHKIPVSGTASTGGG